MKKVIIASDKDAFPLKEAVKSRLLSEGYQVSDVGQTADSEAVLYYTAAIRLAREIQKGTYARGILFCGTGAGVSMVANKFKGVYCVACESIFTAQRISSVNNANVLAMGSLVVSHAMGAEMAVRYLEGIWCDGFAPERTAKIQQGWQILQQLEGSFGQP